MEHLGISCFLWDTLIPIDATKTTLFCWVRLKLYRGKGLEIEANLSNDKNPGCLEYIGD